MAATSATAADTRRRDATRDTLAVVLSRSLPRVVVLLVLGAAAAAAEAPSADELMSRAFRNLYGYDAAQRIEIRSRSASGRDFVREAHVLRDGGRDGRPNRMLVRLLGPGELRGVGLLLLETPRFEYDAFLYQPSLRRTRRISLAQRKDAFFGTDLAFEDLEAKRPEQWSARTLRTEALDGSSVSVVELTPNGIPSGYARILAWLDHEVPVMRRAEFERGGKIVKTVEIDGSRIVPDGGFWVPRRMLFRGAVGSETTVEIEEFALRSCVPDAAFSQQALEAGDERRDARSE